MSIRAAQERPISSFGNRTVICRYIFFFPVRLLVSIPFFKLLYDIRKLIGNCSEHAKVFFDYTRLQNREALPLESKENGFYRKCRERCGQYRHLAVRRPYQIKFVRGPYQTCAEMLSLLRTHIEQLKWISNERNQ